MSHSSLPLSRREWVRLSLAGASGFCLSGWLARLASGAASDPARKRSCILLWMNGGPSQMDTFDLKPGHDNRGPFQEIATAAPGVRISEHLPKLAGRMKHVSLVRSLTSKEGAPGLAPFFAPAVRGHQTAYERAVRLMRSSAAAALKLDEEPGKLRDGYGRNVFGQGCLLARRLVESGVPFVEVSLGGPGGVGWDTHTDNFERVKQLSQTLDAGWAALLDDLKDRGLLETTTV